MTDTPQVKALVDVVAGMEQAFAAGMQGQLQWLEDAALALDAADLGDDGKAAATDLRAALGAMLHWARGTQDKATLPELEGVVRTFMARGLVTLYALMVTTLRELAAAKAPQRAVLLELSLIFEGLHKAIMKGQPPPLDVLKRLQAAKDALS